MGEWIRTADRLPGYNAEYLVCHYRGPFKYCTMQVARYDTDRKAFRGASAYSILCDVTHWMEKPEPPKEGE